LARTNLQQFCATLPEDSYDIEIVDVLVRPRLALAAEILVTPTLEFAHMGSVRRIVGTLGDGNTLRSLLPKLANCGEAKSRT
jgi:hypothetical protein